VRDEDAKFQSSPLLRLSRTRNEEQWLCVIQGRWGTCIAKENRQLQNGGVSAYLNAFYDGGAASGKYGA
jgi:hypothetical protein